MSLRNATDEELQAELRRRQGITQFTDDELRNELHRRDSEKRAKEKAERMAKNTSPWNGCSPGNHRGPYQQFTEVCLNCGRNSYSDE